MGFSGKPVGYVWRVLEHTLDLVCESSMLFLETAAQSIWGSAHTSGYLHLSLTPLTGLASSAWQVIPKFQCAELCCAYGYSYPMGLRVRCGSGVTSGGQEWRTGELFGSLNSIFYLGVFWSRWLLTASRIRPESAHLLCLCPSIRCWTPIFLRFRFSWRLKFEDTTKPYNFCWCPSILCWTLIFWGFCPPGD